ncbi:hypothetical protein HF995_13390 [Sanguibacter hominis ATCC BAA-789]|uniref:HTH cro/C1-type domain-containing protein n=1 Tax=Sanguibacter hominis ATCC BAA-789 TaxID=1312740 RepID=A0A9X5IS57_9MICO|nr:hypothetical protein [Sanguibacter hominis]NKX94250.1 hypothetical protein [Sanguibacter hominis ATCC BAA-789]
MTEPRELEADALNREAAEALTAQIREATARAVGALAEVDEAVEKAWAGRAWIAMGYDSWEGYCTAEFSDTRLWQTVEERQQRTLHLREAGLSTRAIGAVLGVGVGTAHRDLTVVSGVPSGTPDERQTGVDGRNYPSHHVPESVLSRRVKAAELAKAGLSQSQVAAELGVSQGTISSDLRFMTDLVESAPEAAREAVTSNTLTFQTLIENFDVTTTPAYDLGKVAAGAMRDLLPVARYTYEKVVLADAWVEEGQRASAVDALVPSLADAAVALVSAMREINPDEIADAEQRLRWTQTCGDLARLTAAWDGRA